MKYKVEAIIDTDDEDSVSVMRELQFLLHIDCIKLVILAVTKLEPVERKDDGNETHSQA